MSKPSAQRLADRIYEWQISFLPPKEVVAETIRKEYAPLVEAAEGMLRLYESKWSDEPDALVKLRAELARVKGEV